MTVKKCHCLLPAIESPPAVNDDQVYAESTTSVNDDNPDIDGGVENDLLAAADVNIAANNVQDLLAAVDVDIFVNHFHNFKATATVDDDQVEDDLAVDKHLPAMSRKKRMPKRKHKFGKGAKRGGDRKSCRHVEPTAPVNPTTLVLVNPTALVAWERPTAIPVK